MSDGDLAQTLATSTYSIMVISITYIVAKLVGMCAVWVSGYFAETDMNEAFTRRVFLERKSPPRLSRMVGTMLMSYVALSVGLIGIVMGMMYLSSNSPIEQAIVAIWLVFDLAVTVAITLQLGSSIANSVSDQRYFNYSTEGLRAIRSVRRMLVGTSIFVSLWPFAPVLTTTHTRDAIVTVLSHKYVKTITHRS